MQSKRNLAKFDPLIRRLATDHDGERLATVAALERKLAAEGLCFHDLAEALVGNGDEPAPQRQPAKDPPLAEVVRALVNHPGMNDWEAGFINSIRGQVNRRRLTRKQAATAWRIWRRVNA